MKNNENLIKINNRNKCVFVLSQIDIEPVKVSVGSNGYTLEFYFEKSDKLKEVLLQFNAVKAGHEFQFNYRKYLEAEYHINRLIKEAKKQAKSRTKEADSRGRKQDK